MHFNVSSGASSRLPSYIGSSSVSSLRQLNENRNTASQFNVIRQLQQKRWEGLGVNMMQQLWERLRKSSEGGITGLNTSQDVISSLGRAKHDAATSGEEEPTLKVCGSSREAGEGKWWHGDSCLRVRKQTRDWVKEDIRNRFHNDNRARMSLLTVTWKWVRRIGGDYEKEQIRGVFTVYNNFISVFHFFCAGVGIRLLYKFFLKDVTTRSH